MTSSENVKLRIDILTLFPEMFTCLKSSILKRAEDKNLIEINLINFRDFTKNKHNKVDDTPYGHSKGMLLTCQPIYDCIQSLDEDHKAIRIFMDPKGTVFNQQKAKALATKKHLIILCGHYEGVDERVIQLCIDERISIGNFVLTGGEIAAMAVTDCVARMIDGVLGADGGFKLESHYNGYLEEPQYTKPREFMGLSVPEILINGNHKLQEEWRKSSRKPVKN